METINNKKVGAIIRSFDNWMRSHTSYPVPKINAIKDLYPIPYELWYAGITKHNNEKRLKQHLKRNPEFAGIYYKSLDAGSKAQANMVERHFSGKGTKNKPEARGATGESTFAYIFKADANIAEKILGLFSK
jgi:hypothetical protein